MNILITFFLLGKKWGISILTIHFIVVIIYFLFRLEYNILYLAPYTGKEPIYFSVEYLICGSGIGYLLYMFIKNNQHAENAFKKSNEDLITSSTLIARQNEEKVIMLKEIHHRVRNNLQVMMSLLSLQSNELKNKDLYNEFGTATDRIRAVSLIYDKLYKDDMLVHFDIKKFLESLVSHLFEEDFSQKNIKINVVLNKISSKTITPFALIFNELIANSIKLKQTIRNNKALEIQVRIYPAKVNYFHLEYKDNCTWENEDEQSFGQELISIMTEQLDGTMERSYSNEITCHLFLLHNLKEDFLLKQS